LFIGGHFEIARLLLIAGADINATDGNKLTPLHLATKGEINP